LQKRTKVQWDMAPRAAQSLSRLILSNITGFVFFRDRDGPLDLRSQDAARWLWCRRHRSAGALFSFGTGTARSTCAARRTPVILRLPSLGRSVLNGSRLSQSVAKHRTIELHFEGSQRQNNQSLFP